MNSRYLSRSFAYGGFFFYIFFVRNSVILPEYFIFFYDPVLPEGRVLFELQSEKLAQAIIEEESNEVFDKCYYSDEVYSYYFYRVNIENLGIAGYLKDGVIIPYFYYFVDSPYF